MLIAQNHVLEVEPTGPSVAVWAGTYRSGAIAAISCSGEYVTQLYKMGDNRKSDIFSSLYLSVDITLIFKNLPAVCQCVNYNQSYCILMQVL